jgi:tRNA-dihydrouridine synthase A
MTRRGETRAISVAPMMDTTDRHFRFVLRQLTRHTLLYTEMVTTWAILEGDRDRLLGFSEIERPLALQIGGDEPSKVAECARIAEGMGYDEINLNVGCPSDRVQRGSFGACLMKSPERVAAAVKAMRAAVAIPVTVKHRIGVDDQDDYGHMANFVRVVAAEGCDRFSVHARKAWLKGLSPKQNRTVPPLRYEAVYRLKEEFPELVVEINGGITTLDAAATHLERVDAVMIGRAAASNPYLFAGVDRRFFGDETPRPTRAEVVRTLIPYTAEWISRGRRLHHIAQHLRNLFAEQPGARRWRQALTIAGQRKDASPDVLERALAELPS